MLTGGLFSWFASKDPDGLEWAIAQVSGEAELKGPEQGMHAALAALQDRIAILPDYAFRKNEAQIQDNGGSDGNGDAYPESRLGSSVSGIVGGLLALLLAFLIGFLLKKRVRRMPRAGGLP
jgi:cobalt/nickel transport system permease protein